MWPKSRQRWLGFLSVWFTQNPVRHCPCRVCMCVGFICYVWAHDSCDGGHLSSCACRGQRAPSTLLESGAPLFLYRGYFLWPWASVQVSSLVSPSHLAAGPRRPQMRTCTHPRPTFGPALCDLNSGCQVYMTSTFIHWAISRDLFLRCLLWGTARLKHDSQRNNKYKW